MTQFSDFLYSAQESISSFTFQQQQYLIFPSNSNKNWNQDNPASWQFRYQPLFLPKLDSKGKLETQIKQTDDTWTVYITIFLDENTAKKLAFFSLSKVYRSQEYEINSSNISAFPIRYSEIDIPELRRYSQFQILDKEFNFAGSETSFIIRIQTQNKIDAEKLASEILPTFKIEYSYSASVKKLGQNFVRVTFDRIKDSSRFAKLIGFGDKAFIHRDDERLLAEEIYTKVKIDTSVEDKDQFIGEIQNQLMSFVENNISISEEKFDQEKWNITYNKEDLKPDVLTKTLNKLFTKDEQENNWKINRAADLNCNAEVINKIKVAPIDIFDSTIKGGVSTKGSLSNDELKKLLKHYDITVEIEGNKIIAKSVNVKEINLAKLKSTGSLQVKNQFIDSRETHLKGFIEIYKYPLDFNKEEIYESEINIKLLLQELYNKFPNLNRSHDRDILAELILFIADSMARNNKKYSIHQLIQISLGLHSESNLLIGRGSNSNSNYIDERYWLKLKDCLMAVEDVERTAKVKTLLDEKKNQEDIDNRDNKGQLLPPI